MSAGAEVATYLQHAGIGELGATLFVGYMPETAPDDAVAVMEYGGMMGAQPLEDPMAYEMPRLQVMVRSASYFDGMTKARDAYRALGKVVNTTLGGVRYQRITPVQPPFLIRRDDNGRPEIGFNVEITKEVGDA